MEVKMKDNTKIIIAILIAFLLAMTSYITTAFFIKTWPFSNSKPTLDDLINQTTDDDVGKLNNLEQSTKSDGELKSYSDFLIQFPKDWFLMRTKDSGMISGIDALEPLISVSVQPLGKKEIFGSVDGIDAKTISEQMLKSNDKDFEIGTTEEVKSFGRDCIVFSGSSKRMGEKIGMLVLIVPGGEKGYLVMGTFSSDDQNTKEIVENVMATFRPLSK